MQGRGASAAGPQHFLNYLNQYNAYQVKCYLTEEERTALGTAYPRFQVKKQPQKGTNANAKATANAHQDEVCTATKELEETKTEEIASSSEEPQDTPQEEEKEGTKKDEKSSAKPSVSDPHTLLARLNSKRLYRRIRYHQQQNKEFDPREAYPLNKSTEQIAIFEWQVLMRQFKNKQSGTIKQDDEPNNQEKEEAKQEEPKLPSPTNIPSSCELLLFSPCPRAVAVLASYPRSGNSLLRNLYERTTLRVTGSDMRGGLTQHDLVGEAATQTNCVQFVKTHFPERRGTPPFRVSRAVLLVRNPYDAMESYFNLMMTNTHTTSLSEVEREKNAKVFADMALKEIQVWRDFHEYWLQQDIPLLVIRYEDLIRYTDKVIAKVIRFVLEIKDMKFFENRIDRCIREEQIERLGSYRPRSGGIGKSLSKYSPELLQQVNMGILSTMAKLGYAEMLVPNPSEWELEPLDQYGVEIPGSSKTPLTINGKNLVRGPKRHTDWRVARRQLNTDKKDNKCTCYKCLRGGR
jgi:hypothetical protein